MKTFKIFLYSLTLLTFAFASAQQKNITGLVSSNDMPITGVSIIVKGTTIGSMTDFDGNFSIKASATDFLIVSYLGYKSQELLVGNNTVINVNLVEDINQLDEIVLIGYGGVKKKDLTGAVSTVKGEELNKRSVANIQDALGGQLPGVQVSSGGGAPGAEASIKIRGFSTLNDNGPLYVVDDVALDDISFLTPNDVESIQVLKDASASAIYGSRASNGVVIITTKKGKVGKTSVSLNISSSMQSVARKPNMANATEYAATKNAASLNDGDTPLYPDPSTFGVGTDWWDQIMQTALFHNVGLNISSGTEKLKVSSGFSYQNQEGIQKGGGFERITVRLNTEYKLLDNLTFVQDFNIGSSNTVNGPNLIWDVQRLEPTTNPFLPSFELSPEINEFSIFSPTITDVPNAVGNLARNFNETDYLRGTASVSLNWEIIEGLSFKTHFATYFASFENNWFAPNYFIEPNDQQLVNAVNRTHNNRTNNTWNNILTYSKDIKEHSFTAMGGVITEDREHRTLSAQGLNIPSNQPSLRYLEAAEPGLFNASGNNENYNLLSYIGRLNYSFKGKYLLNATTRTDGSSLFPEENKWASFSSISGAWVVSDEDFIGEDSFISYLKIRAGWGQIGNDNRNSLPVTARLTTIANDFYTTGSEGTLAIGGVPGNVGNPNIKWETVEDFNLGVDINLFENKLGINLDVYKRKTFDMLMPKNIPAYLGSGYDAQWANVGNFENQGVDLGINFKTQLGNVKSNFTLNLSHYTATVSRLADGEAIREGNHQRLNLLAITSEGQTPGLFYGYVTDGVFQNRTEINSHSDRSGNIIQPNAQPGDFRFKDLNGDGQLTEDGDRQVIGDPTPDFTFGFIMNFEYKRFDFSALFRGSYGNDMLNAAKPYLNNGGELYNSYAGTLNNAWSGEGSTNSEPRLTIDDPNANFRYSDYYMEDGSFLRLQNIQVGYNFNETFTTKIGLKKARFYASAENVFTLTSFSGLDPDVGGSATLRGVEWGNYPLPRMVSMGLNLTF
tara:strand:+ start:1062 stop:4097 length:3036 start_codon:yes stop_codon:yes gene_type:complete